MDPNAVNAALVGALVSLVTGIVEAIRRGWFVARFVYDREAQRADLADQRADRLEAAIAALTRVVEARADDRKPPPGPTA